MLLRRLTLLSLLLFMTVVSLSFATHARSPVRLYETRPVVIRGTLPSGELMSLLKNNAIGALSSCVGAPGILLRGLLSVPFSRN
ncbi:MAG: hypothetical protein HYU64_01130 [Armatimonadetes bacterium]|nr:hypothetical protein [Armatimonadota bacterium]